jgi:hypothetical protein
VVVLELSRHTNNLEELFFDLVSDRLSEVPVMTAIAPLTRAKLRKLATTRAFFITLAIAVAMAVISVAVNAVTAGKNGTPALGTAASAYQMFRLGSVCCVAIASAWPPSWPRCTRTASHIRLPGP